MRIAQTMPVKKFFWLTLGLFGIITVLTALLAPMLVQRFYPLPVDQGASWYYWQLASTSTAARISYWLGFALHLSVVGYLAFRAKKVKPADKNGIHAYTVKLLVSNLVFVVLHLVQTSLWYDGLAQDVPIWVSQGSVIVMLVLILYLMIPSRGLFWGKRFAPPSHMLAFVRTWHGPFNMLALILTFWFHPMDGNWGLLSGFIYMFLLFTQLILMNTRMHYNRTWIVLLEFFVTIHGTLITVYKDNPIWPMFFFGFLAMFVFTQVHTWKIKPLVRWSVFGGYIILILLVYGFIRGFNHVYEITFIPVALYGGALGMLLVGYLWDKLAKKKPAAPSKVA